MSEDSASDYEDEQGRTGEKGDERVQSVGGCGQEAGQGDRRRRANNLTIQRP